MGFFDKAKNSRIMQIINNHFGNGFPIEFAGGGSFSCSDLNIRINPVFAVVGIRGIAFIHQGKVVLVLKWSDILSCSRIRDDGNIEITFWAPETGNMYAYSREYPYRYFHNATLKFLDKSHADKTKVIFEEIKFYYGYTEESLILNENWIQWKINEPVTLEKFHQINNDWGTAEIRESSYEVWGEFMDAERFLYFVGRNVCSGELPSKFVELAFNEYVRLNSENTKFTKKSNLPDEKTRKIIDQTGRLDIFRGADTQIHWFQIKVEVKHGEWVGNMPIQKRRAVAKVVINKNGLGSTIELRNDFHEGTQIPTFLAMRTKVPNQLKLIDNFVTFQEADFSRVLELIERDDLS